MPTKETRTIHESIDKILEASPEMIHEKELLLNHTAYLYSQKMRKPMPYNIYLKVVRRYKK